MKAILRQGEKTTELDLSQIKSISAVSQCNIIVTKTTGEQLTGISVEVQ